MAAASLSSVAFGILISSNAFWQDASCLDQLFVEIP